MPKLVNVVRYAPVHGEPNSPHADDGRVYSNHTELRVREIHHGNQDFKD